MSVLSEKIKELRKSKNMSQAELAKELGVKTSTISNYETGKTVPTKANLKKLSEVLGEELVAEEPSKVEVTLTEKKNKTATSRKEKTTKKAPVEKDEPAKEPEAAKEAQADIKEKEEKKEVIIATEEKVEAKSEEVKEEEKPAEKPASKTNKGGRKASAKTKMPLEEAVEKVKKNPKVAKAVDTLKEAVEKEMAKKKTFKPVISVQAMLGGTITVEEILAKVKAAAPDAKQVYVKPEENKAYWVSKTSAGAVDLWD